MQNPESNNSLEGGTLSVEYPIMHWSEDFSLNSFESRGRMR